MSRQPLSRSRVVFTGHVQGVGFRATTRSIAGCFAVGGYVRNLPDGSVEMVVEGMEEEMASFREEVESRLGRFIHDRTVERLAGNGEFSEFDIRY